jgi:hypothetical protein
MKRLVRLFVVIRAASARDAIASTVLAHCESDDIAPFNDADYSNAYGPTVRFPVTPKRIEGWAF